MAQSGLLQIAGVTAGLVGLALPGLEVAFQQVLGEGCPQDQAVVYPLAQVEVCPLAQVEDSQQDPAVVYLPVLVAGYLLAPAVASQQGRAEDFPLAPVEDSQQGRETIGGAYPLSSITYSVQYACQI